MLCEQDTSCIHVGVLMQKHMEITVLQVLHILHWFVLDLSPFSFDSMALKGILAFPFTKDILLFNQKSLRIYSFT